MRGSPGRNSLRAGLTLMRGEGTRDISLEENVDENHCRNLQIEFGHQCLCVEWYLKVGLGWDLQLRQLLSSFLLSGIIGLEGAKGYVAGKVFVMQLSLGAFILGNFLKR